MMFALNFPEIESVDDKCHVAMFGKPGSMMLIICLVSIRDAVFENAGVTAEIEDGRGRSGQCSRYVSRLTFQSSREWMPARALSAMRVVCRPK